MGPEWHAMLHRLRTDFRLSVITLLATCAVLVITPFAVFRFSNGEFVAGLIDSVIVVGIIILVAFTWVTGKTGWTGLLLALFVCGGATVVALLQGEFTVFWLFPTYAAAFFLTSPAIAAALGAASVLIVVSGGVFDAPQPTWAFVAASFVVGCCALVFALRTESQRQQLERLATFDPLTGVRNRRAMDQELHRAAATASRTGLSYALVMLDLDHFKRVNDRYGHSAGDEVLKSFGRLIEDNIRRVDHVFRFGGEEFVILLTDADGKAVSSVVASLQEKIARELRTPGGEPITASFGAAVIRLDESAESWLGRADAALYRAKDAGRDRLVLDSAGEPLQGGSASAS